MSVWPHSLYKIADWEPQVAGSAILGTKTYDRTFAAPEGTWQETTTLTVTHAPQE